MQKRMRIDGVRPSVCARCGRSPRAWMDQRQHLQHIACARCHLSTPSFRTQAEAVAAWNTAARRLRHLNNGGQRHD